MKANLNLYFFPVRIFSCHDKFKIPILITIAQNKNNFFKTKNDNKDYL